MDKTVILPSKGLIANQKSVGQLVPIHIRIDKAGRATAKEVQQLIDYNRVRFALIGINSGLCFSSYPAC